MWDPPPIPGISSEPPALGARNPSHRIARFLKEQNLGRSWRSLFYLGEVCRQAHSSCCPQIFRLTRSKVDDDKARILIRSLLDHPALEELDLSHNLIGDRGARAAAKLLSHSRLRVLNLANNQVRAPGAHSLAHALGHNGNLISLNLRLNCIEDEGGQALAHALHTNKCLTTLHLGGNELSEPTATLLSQVLTINTTLTSINLSCNHIGLVSQASGARRAKGKPWGLGRRAWNLTAAVLTGKLLGPQPLPSSHPSSAI